MLEIKELYVNIDGKEILSGINLTLDPAKTNVLMGPNGHGKSTLSSVIMGDPKFEVTKGEIWFKGQNILELEVDQRAKLGLFMVMQYPSEIAGINNIEFLRAAVKQVRPEMNLFKFATAVDDGFEYLAMKQELRDRSLNEGFSGGEKKKNEILQMLLLRPDFSLIDEVDSGLDIDAIKYVAKGINKLKEEQKGCLIITHYNRLLQYVKPDRVIVLKHGKIVADGNNELIEKLEQEGYDAI